MINAKYRSVVIFEKEKGRKGRKREEGDTGKGLQVAFTIFIVLFLEPVVKYSCLLYSSLFLFVCLKYFTKIF